ncbi:cuticle protein CP14.6-like [Penaeus vannamei]|uniref:cuticle protein CP14.6-like n=1 Tax=Penaeus vannamei TaxID=6689 RepID=UPI00387F6B76
MEYWTWKKQLAVGRSCIIVDYKYAGARWLDQQYHTASATMKFVILAALAAVAAAVPQGYGAPPPRYDSSEEIAILRNDFVIEDDGRYNFDAETANGIVVSEHGTPGDKGAINSAGSFSYTAPDGTDVHLQFVADENGFQPQGAHLPVAPEFPHPIPQFVLDQIAFAAQEDARRPSEPSSRYGAP